MEIENDQNGKLLKKIRESFSNLQLSFEAERPIAEEILRDSKAKYNDIMGMLNDQLHQAEIDRAKREAEIAELKNKLKSATAENELASRQLSALRAEKTTIETNLGKAQEDMLSVTNEVAMLKSELAKADSLVSTAVAEKNKMEKKLNQFQEQWDKYIAGS